MSETAQAAAKLGDENQLVTFSLGEEEFGFDIMSVQEIIRLPKMSRVPMAPDYLEGVANLRGTIMPIIDTRTRFGMPRAEETDRTRVLVIDVEGVKTGLRVDVVKQVTRISRTDEDTPPLLAKGLSADFLRGVVKMDGGKRMILNLDPKPICQVSIDRKETQEASSSEATTVSSTGENTHRETTQIVSFRLGEEEYAFPMSKVREILRFQRPNVLPNVPQHILGILTVRERILPVIDLRLILGLKSLPQELIHQSTYLREQITTNREAIKSLLSLEGSGRVDSHSLEALVKWVTSFSTANQAITTLLTKLRAAVERLSKGLHRLEHFSRGLDSPASESHAQELDPVWTEILSLLGEFETSIGEAIQEDQRLVVIESSGQILALVVDKVREVLSVANAQIDPPPRMGSANGFLSGVAKLNESKRIILLLEAQNFTQDEAMRALAQQTSKGDSTMKQEDKSHANTLSGERQFVTFRLADGEYGIPISQIQEIDRSSKMTKIPSAPDYMEGICSLRGEIIPVINARKRFNLENKELDDRTRVIIMDFKGSKTGLMVDAVREVLNLSTEDISNPPGSVSTGIAQQYISGIGKVDDGKRIVVLLDVEKIIS